MSAVMTAFKTDSKIIIVETDNVELVKYISWLWPNSYIICSFNE